jgi:hypothetical protein
MAETTNNFTGGRMNKDIDDRLLPENEYRNAINLQISKSENSDVGALQTILGNELVVNFNTLTGSTDLDCIGYFVDTSNNRVFLFLTNYTSPSTPPYYSPTADNYIYVYNVLQNTYIKLVEGAFLNFSKNSPIIGVNLLEDLLFWTDNRNQPRKINVTRALNSSTYYTIEDQISVAKLSPVYAPELYTESTEAPGEYETTMYDVSSEFLPPYGSTAIVNGAITATNTFVIDDPVLEFDPSPGQLVSGTGIPNDIRVVTYNDPLLPPFTVVVSGNITLADNQVIKFNANPYYNPNFIGDPTYLEDKFVRFSYRFRFDDNEYSIFAPFTQIAFIPKQDGYFLYEPNVDPTQEPLVDNETAAFRSTILSFMYNKVNDIYLQIKLPCPGNMLESVCKISEVDILYKESNGLAVQVVDIIPVSEIAAQAGSSDLYVYNYQSKKPFKTLPERDLIRVYDKTPVKALGQEIISNRVVYSNYQDKQGYPKFFNYNVTCNNKAEFDPERNYTSKIEYPNHSVKQNRNYEVGVILSDKFGRQSGVILSNAVIPADLGTTSYGAASLYVPYFEEEEPGSNIPQNGEIINQWPGYSLKVLFNEVISGNGILDWPGLYNGDAASIDYNPLGWYSYKIVVKQNEQDYYNVYLPGVMASYPVDDTKELGKTSHFVIIGDNINKVPRDLNDISGTQEQYRSSVRLYSRVNNIYSSLEPDFLNQQFYPGNTFSFVNTIATLNSLFPESTQGTATTVPIQYYQFYQNISNPLIGRLSTVSKIGITTAGLPDPVIDQVIATANLAVMETEPVDSRLDLYWETATSGIITELNEAIATDSDAPYSLIDWSFELFESAELGDDAVTGFYFADVLGIPMSFAIGQLSLQVFDQLNNPVVGRFQIVEGAGDTFNLITTDYFYYGDYASDIESYKFFITVTTPTTSTEFQKTGALQNVAPIINPDPLINPTIYNFPIGQVGIHEFVGVNGSNINGGDQLLDLTWTITSYSPDFYIDPVTGLLVQPSGDIVEGSYVITIRLTDAGGLFDEITITVNLSEEYGIIPIVIAGGPGYVSTGEEITRNFSSLGTIQVIDGVTAIIRAGAFPFPWGPNRVLAQVTITGPGEPFPVLIADYDDGLGGYSIDEIELVGPNTWSFDVTVTYFGTDGGPGGMYIN